MGTVALQAGDVMEAVMPGDVGFSAERLERIRPAMQRYVDEGKLAEGARECGFARPRRLCLASSGLVSTAVISLKRSSRHSFTRLWGSRQ